jgi:curved DNA binding protein|mmetsp:Transcript_56291/g.89376  ORF Transcript_56291/g.89376 Transcript_56291/m.89376 type:complete len:391 (+) Transcript_56291:62-1234(+)|eukprot:CAMPEP_0169123042 /NCGR_PEP_ID=MMETSP1015-20121227/33574_1 /TAXON_ID=342587 /ORGANISM="Karlodinium micrum, Strain CCMP2283" /LENGTH=390 /DNA_ID=CAMNT_0009186353 /DNA_START=62 /DNA_END=1234 /DNA_ORIENTATION=-
MSDHESEAEEVNDLSNPDVTTKYRTAGDIVNKVLAKIIEECKAEADIATLCEMGDKMLEEETGKLYNKKDKGRKIEKGIAFPTCISTNEVIGHFSPLKGESRQLKPGDVAKVDMACHIDGFIAAAAHTVIIGEEKAEDRRADAVMAAWNAAEATLRLVQVGNTNTQVTEMLGKIAEEFKCKPVQGVLSHQMKKHVIDGNKCIIGAETAEEKVDEIEFEMNEVYCIDIVMSTGEGKGKETEMRHTVYKRAPGVNYMLKTQKARQFITEVNRRFPALPFSLRAIEDEQVARVGVSEAKRHELLEEYPVLKEKDKEVVAQFKFTVCLLPGGTKKITGLPLNESQVASSLSVQDEDLKKLLATSANPKKSKKKKAAASKDEKAEEKKEDEAEEK